MSDYKPKKKKYKYGTIVPLIGGMTVGNSMATGKDPDFFLSYPAFAGNDSHAKRYFKDTPYYTIDPETNEFMEPTEENPDINENIDKASWEGVDFITSVCPCAGLSMMNASQKAGSTTARGSDAAQNQWMYKSSEFVLENIKPKVLWGENAPGLYTKTGKGVVEKLKEIAEKYNYSFSLYKTNTIYHGIPQKRERTFFFFWKAEHAPLLEFYRRDYVPLKEYLNEIPEDASQHSKEWIPGYKDFDQSIYRKYLTEVVGGNWRDQVNECKTMTYFIVKNKRLDEIIDYLLTEEGEDSKALRYFRHVKNKLSMGKGWWDGSPHFFNETINAVIGRTILTTIHPEHDRGLTVREILHLMGLPHDFEIGKLKQYNHIAQNVPTCTARDMTFEVMKFIDGKLENHNDSFLRQSNSAKKTEKPVKAKELF